MTRTCSLLLVLAACSPADSSSPPIAEENQASHAWMVERLQRAEVESLTHNLYLSEGWANRSRAELEKIKTRPVRNRLVHQIPLSQYLLRLGKDKEAIDLLTEAYEATKDDLMIDQDVRYDVAFRLGLAWMRIGETKNCCANNNEDSCLMPIRGDGIHKKPQGSEKALEMFRFVVSIAPVESEYAIKSRWLMNVAAMTLGTWPEAIPIGLRLREEQLQSPVDFPEFPNVAGDLKLASFDNCGGVVVDDFDGDEWLDIVVSTWDPTRSLRFYRNQGDGTFEEVTKESGLKGIKGGLNLVQADYDNDGDLDLYVCRGAWWGVQGRHPNSLLANDGTGRFVDVTRDCGLGDSAYPSGAATFGDYDNDGDLDLYTVNEATEGSVGPCQLFRNDGKGHFVDVAQSAGVQNNRFGKGAAWGDIDGDGLLDLYVSNLRGENRLYHNQGDGKFVDIAKERGVEGPFGSFPTWFWDYDNDGALDLYVAGYDCGTEAIASHYFNLPDDSEPCALYRGDGSGQFENLARNSGLGIPVPVMGSNFGDLDNDGFLDFFLGTGDTRFETLLPNLMYLNQGGKSFANVTTAGRFGNLQKGHGVAFADLDNDGDQDVFQQMGGAFLCDRFYNALYENPGFENRHWIALRLQGSEANRCAIGAELKLTLEGEDGQRELFRRVGTGSSFGGNPLRVEAGLGTATRVTRLEVLWPGSRKVEVFEDLAADRLYRITEGNASAIHVPLKAAKLGQGAH